MYSINCTLHICTCTTKTKQNKTKNCTFYCTSYLTKKQWLCDFLQWVEVYSFPLNSPLMNEQTQYTTCTRARPYTHTQHNQSFTWPWRQLFYPDAHNFTDEGGEALQLPGGQKIVKNINCKSTEKEILIKKRKKTERQDNCLLLTLSSIKRKLTILLSLGEKKNVVTSFCFSFTEVLSQSEHCPWGRGGGSNLQEGEYV